VVGVCIFSDDGRLAASGYAAETSEAFIYDRIVTDAYHRRKGLGHAVMATLRSAKRNSANPELLVATEDGKALYSTLGWRIVSPYSTAAVPHP
jgi:predicted GNAT family N-acyltransferase